MKRDHLLHPSIRASLGLKIEGVASETRLKEDDAIKITSLGGGVYYLGIDLESPECERIIGMLQRECRVPQTSHFNLYYNEEWWEVRDDSWVGAMFLTDPWVDISPANTFDPSCPPPCFGLVPSHLPLHVLSQPKGIVVDVEHDTIFSEQIAAYLASIASCQFGEVYLNNNLLRSHRRVIPEQLRRVFAIELMDTVNCAACGTRILTHRGAVVGRLIDDLVVCRNEEGVWHMAAEHPVIVSVDVAGELKKRFPRGFGLEPILNIDTPLGQRIVQLTRRLQALEVFRNPKCDQSEVKDRQSHQQ